MKTYSLSKLGTLKLQRTLVLTSSTFSVVLFIALLAGSLLGGGNGLAILLSLLLMGGFLVFVVNRSIKQQREIWESIRIILGDDYIPRQQIRIPEIHINRSEINSIQEMDAGIGVKTADKFHSLVIPASLDKVDLAEIRSTLGEWAPIQPKAENAGVKTIVLTIVLLAGFGIIFFSLSPWLILVVGLGMIGYYGYYSWLLQRAKGVDPVFRRNFVRTLGFILFILLMKLCFLLGWYQSLLKNLGH
jgi:hypothetical protein